MASRFNQNLPRSFIGVATVIGLFSVGCGQAPAIDAKDVHLSQTDPVHDSITYALGLAKGTLTLEAGCVRFASEERGTLTPVVSA